MINRRIRQKGTLVLLDRIEEVRSWPYEKTPAGDIFQASKEFSVLTRVTDNVPYENVKQIQIEVRLRHDGTEIASSVFYRSRE